MIAEYNASNGLLRRYVHGPGVDEPILWYEGSGIADKRYLTADERGSITSVTNATGVVMQINSYDDYGIPATTNLGRFQYTGQTWLPEVGLYYYKARIYSPTLGRFLQTDPIGYEDGLNWYDYVGGDPVNGRDPSGLLDIVVTGVGGSNDDIVVTGAKISEGSDFGFDAFFFLSTYRVEDNGRYDEFENEITVTARPKPKPKPRPQSGHKYVIDRESDCSANQVFNDFKQSGRSAPGAPAASEGFTPRVNLSGGNPISQTVNSASRTIVNTTLPGHIFYPGSVTIQVDTLSSGGSEITITGTGTGNFATLNDIAGKIIFGTLANESAFVCHRLF